jgi:DNA topoisomerase-1
LFFVFIVFAAEDTCKKTVLWMILIIAEKAIAGRRIAAILAGRELAGERSGYAVRFDFEKDGKKYTVLPLSGHIVDVDFPVSYKHWLGTDLKKLAFAEVNYVETEKAISGLIKKVAPEVTDVIIATDADREGEAIGLEALNILKEVNPNVSVKRANFSAITEKDIKDAFSSLALLDFNLAESANSRREIDLVWGAVLTRFLSLISGRLGKEFISTGRVQGPTLALIVDREKARLAFEVKKYWQVEAVFEKGGVQFTALHREGKFWDLKKAEAVMACAKPPVGIVSSVEKKKKLLSRPEPFNTTSFLRAATAIGFTAGRAMQIAESLYQAGIISYPRTDNSVYPPTLGIRAVLTELGTVKEFSPLVSKLLALGKLVPSAGKLAKDHPPIHPVSAAQKGRLDPQAWKVYELVCRRFMATLAEDAVTENILAEIGLNGQPFGATGQTYVELGWKFFYPYSKATETVLPMLERGDKVNLVTLENLAKETLPPPRYSQGSLIKAMSDLNLGTKSTRAETIQKLYSRKYIEGQKAIVPTKVAIAVIDGLEKHNSVVVMPEMTANLEKEMDMVASGQKAKEVVVNDSRNFLSDALVKLLENRNEIGSAIRNAARSDSIMGACTNESCGGELLVRHGKTGKRFLGCSNYPKCTVTWPLPQNGSISVIPGKCEHCGTPLIQVVAKRFRYKMCIDPNCKSKADWARKKEEREKSKSAAVAQRQAGAKKDGPVKKESAAGPVKEIAPKKGPFAKKEKREAGAKKPRAKAGGAKSKKQ